MARPLSRYSLVAIGLHWLVAALIVINILLAWSFQNIGQGLASFKLIQLHKSVGITVLLLSLVRLAWRLFNPPPPPLPAPRWQILASQLVHWGFYVIMIGMPLSGWVMVSVNKYNLPTLLYGVIPWPHIAPLHALPPEARKVWGDGSAKVHLILAWSAYGLILLHVAAALKHQFFDRDNLIYRMAPFFGRPKQGATTHAS